MKATALSRLVLLLLKHARGPDLPEKLSRWAEVWREVYTASGGEALVRVVMCILECRDDVTEEDLRAIEKMAEAREGEVLMSLAEKWRQEGWQKGRQEGWQKGRLQTLVGLVGKQLALRFGSLGAEVEARLAEATEVDLEAVAEALLTADSLEEALAPLR